MAHVKVALIGDSIRLRAEPYVRQRLPSLFQVASPPVNCKSSRDVARMIQDWASPSTADIVHINCGLHDIRHDPGQDRPVVSLNEYASNLQDIFAYLATTGASVIWATTTPVFEGMHDKAFHRWYRSDLVQYNALSVTLARGFGFDVNDLYVRLSEMALESMFLSDGVHFNHRGNQLIGRYVADAIQACGA